MGGGTRPSSGPSGPGALPGRLCSSPGQMCCCRNFWIPGTLGSCAPKPLVQKLRRSTMGVCPRRLPWAVGAWGPTSTVLSQPPGALIFPSDKFKRGQRARWILRCSLGGCGSAWGHHTSDLPLADSRHVRSPGTGVRMGPSSGLRQPQSLTAWTCHRRRLLGTSCPDTPSSLRVPWMDSPHPAVTAGRAK